METKIFLLRIQLKGTICQANIYGTNNIDRWSTRYAWGWKWYI